MFPFLQGEIEALNVLSVKKVVDQLVSPNDERAQSEKFANVKKLDVYGLRSGGT